MNIQPLSTLEKKKLKSLLIQRLVFLFIFILPLLYAYVIFIKNVIGDLAINHINGLTWFGIFLIVVFTILLIGLVIPFYIRTFKHCLQSSKRVVDTVILGVTVENSISGILPPRYIIKTEYKELDSWAAVILNLGLSLQQLRPGMEVRIHYTVNRSHDILFIERR
ncbi:MULTISPECIES: hypothetical protein [Pedobacter]|nr:MULTISPECIES: hypothetical protein [Pedobacter]MBB5437548.1 cation transport ATPase [Pedobacter sp. AK017]